MKKSFIALALAVMLVSPAQAQDGPLPDWTQVGYRGTGILPTDADLTDDEVCIVTPEELREHFSVVPDDGIDDSAQLQSAIDDIRDHCEGDYDRMALIELPAGTLNISTEIHVDASFLIIRGQGAALTQLVFEPDENTIYDGIPDFDLNAMEGIGTSNGGWIWPGRGAFRVQTRAVHEDYQRDFEDSPANRRDFFEGSVNFHWKTGIPVAENSQQGDRIITLRRADTIHIGDTVWVGAPNTAKMYSEQGVDPDDWLWWEYMRQQMFTVMAIDGDTITLDKPLEFDLPRDSSADGSAPIDGEVREAKVVPLTVVEGVGFEDFSLTQILPGHNEAEAVFNYTNLDPLRAMHGFVFKWAINSYMRGVGTQMTGSHAVVTEMARHIQIEDSVFTGSWNKGEGGNGYFRLSKVWDSLAQHNTLRGLRHLAVLWSASGNVIQGNDIDADLNLHGGWERYNLFQNNLVRVPFEHRHCCQPGDETWYPIWWGAGAHAGEWAGASGPQNVFYNNSLQKQTSDGSYEDFMPYTSRDVIYMFGWDADTPAGSHWVHLAVEGVPIESWTHREHIPYHEVPNTGVNARCSSRSDSLVTADVICQ